MGGEASRNVITQHDSDHRRHLEKELGGDKAGGLKAALAKYEGFGSQGATPEVSPLHPELAPVSDACETAQRPTQPGKQELREFCRQVEAAVARKQAMADAPYEEPSTWVNYVGGSLNTRSRVHKPHHTIQTTPYLSQSVVTSYIKGGGAASLAAAANASVPFKRRNSTGSLEVRLTVDNMDVAGMVRVIALILHHHILQGSALDWPIAKQFAIFDDSVMSFRACRNGEMPTFEQVHDFFSYIYRTAQLECDCVVTSLFYIERLLMETAGELRMCRTNWRSITLSGMILASKVWDDLSMWSVDFARVGRLTLKRINELEVAVLQALQYNVRVDSSNFARYFFRLRNWCLLLSAAASAAANARNKAIAISTAGGDDAHKRRRSYTDSMVPPPPPVRTRSLPGRCMPPPLQIQRKTTLSSSQFESIYKGLSPCLEELVEGPQTDAGGSRECCRDLKEHERRASIGYCLRKRQKKAIIQNLILSEVRDVCAVYDVEPMRLLGVGISGVVQIVRHRGTGVEYAMKTLRLDRLRDFRKMGELRNEIEVMSTLNHPNIVRLLEIYESPARDTVSLIMELCTGGELLTRLNANGRYSEALCADLARKMLSAVRHCHDHSICHRDLKLENWVFEDASPTAELKLIDFGLSRHFGENEVMHVPVGTPYSVAPEVLSGSYTCACDLWSLGVLVFMLLTGNAPFAGADDFAVLEAVKAGVWSWPADMRVSAVAKSFVEHLLVLDPAKRMTAVQALKHPWIAQVVSPRATVVAPSPNVLESLRQFEHMSAVKRLVLQMVAFSMEPWQVDALRQEFQIIDTDCNGLISLDDMRYALERSGAVADNNELRALLDAVAMDHSGNIRYNDFLAAGLMSLGPATVLDERNLRAVFDKFDRRKEGWISAEAFSDFLGKQITADEISEVLTEAGVAANWRIDFQGFVHIMRSATASPKTPCTLHADPVDAAITAAYAEAFPSM